ncbi:hypothetical protein AB9F44_34190, partial [Rhizobium leguminosarum]|uniref:hypothetical protein n=1 Tax=Rhizobium leguminosarum TaxID=384 RepID=UPI003F9972F1
PKEFCNNCTKVWPTPLYRVVPPPDALSAGDQRRNGVAIRTHFANSLPPVNGDRVQLQQVINNLLRNAIDAVSGVKDRLRSVEIQTEL